VRHSSQYAVQVADGGRRHKLGVAFLKTRASRNQYLVNQILLLSLAQTTTPPGGAWPGPLTYIGVAMLIAAAVIYFLNRRAPPDDKE
jgi:hypothetical protein